jgi:dolichol-phosphate mannosyltransferase
MRCLVIVPTYNEKENLRQLVDETLKQGSHFNMLIVDDGSPDGTGEIADEIARERPEVHVLHRQGKLGLGTAYIAGFKYGLKEGYDYIFEMDADFSHDPSYLPKLLAAAQKYDVVIGSRNVKGGGSKNWSKFRILISRGGSAYARAVLGLRVRDVTAGFKCFRRQVLETIDLDAVRSTGYGFQVEMNYRTQLAGFRLGEVPIIFADRVRGTSKMSSRIFFEALWMVLKMRYAHMTGADFVSTGKKAGGRAEVRR